jgi:hypothetical protein
MEALLINTEGKERKLKINTFDDARQIVCNYNSNALLQILSLPDGRGILLDEEGKLKNLDFNEKATILAHESNVIYPSDYIVGDILVVDLDEFDGLPYE